MKRDVLNDDDYDEVCRVIGDAVVVLTERGHDARRGEIYDLLKRTRQQRTHSERDEQRLLDHAIRLVKPDK